MAAGSSSFLSADDYFNLLQLIFQRQIDHPILFKLREHFPRFLRLNLPASMKEKLIAQLGQFAAIKKISVKKIQEDIQNNGEKLKQIKMQFDEDHGEDGFDSVVGNIIASADLSESFKPIPMNTGTSTQERKQMSALVIKPTTDDRIQVAKYFFEQGYILLTKKNPKAAIFYLKQAVELAELIPLSQENILAYKEHLCSAYQNYGVSLVNNENLKKGIAYLEKAIALAEAISLPIPMINAFKHNLCLALNNYGFRLKNSDSIAYYERAIALAETIAFSFPIAKKNLCLALNCQGNFKEALAVAESILLPPKELAEVLNEIGESVFGTKVSIVYFEKAIALAIMPESKIFTFNENLYRTLDIYGNSALKNKNPLEAILCFEKIITMADAVFLIEEEVDAFKKKLCIALNEYGTDLFAQKNPKAIIYFQKAVLLAETLSPPLPLMALFKKNLVAAQPVFERLVLPGTLFSPGERKLSSTQPVESRAETVRVTPRKGN